MSSSVSSERDELIAAYQTLGVRVLWLEHPSRDWMGVHRDVEEVEASLTREPFLGHLASDYQCEKAPTRRWDYICSYA